jgi:hypothetical protein
MTLVAIYGLNEDNPDFLKRLLFNINQFDNLSVIIAGDWNVNQNYGVDTVNYTGEHNPKSKLEIHEMINNMDLVDVWRKKIVALGDTLGGALVKNNSSFFDLKSVFSVKSTFVPIVVPVRLRCAI